MGSTSSGFVWYVTPNGGCIEWSFDIKASRYFFYMNRILGVYIHNLLAPRWAIPRHYPEATHHLFTDHEKRFAKAMENIETQDPDIVFLQEVEESGMDRVEERFRDTYRVTRSYHHPDLWRDWKNLETPESSDSPHGLLTLTRNSLPLLDSRSIPLSPDGNCASILTLGDTSNKIYCVNTHLDTLNSNLRQHQMSSMEKHIVKLDSSDPIVWGGDFNMDLTRETKPEGFNIMSVSGDTAYDLLNSRRVDFIMSRSGRVLSSSEPPITTSLVDCLQWYGSDHVPVYGEFRPEHSIPF